MTFIKPTNKPVPIVLDTKALLALIRWATAARMNVHSKTIPGDWELRVENYRAELAKAYKREIQNGRNELSIQQ